MTAVLRRGRRGRFHPQGGGLKSRWECAHAPDPKGLRWNGAIGPTHYRDLLLDQSSIRSVTGWVIVRCWPRKL